MAAVVASFVLALWISQRHLSDIEDEVYAIAANAQPSIVHLGTARSNLERVGIFADEYLEATSTDLSTARASLAKALQTRDELDRSVAAYGRLPFFAGEEELYGELRQALDPVERSLRVVLDRVSAHDLPAARMVLARDLRPSIDRADEIVTRIVDLDSSEAQRHLEAIRASRRHGATTAIALGTFSLVLSCIASAFAFRSVAREATRQQALERERTARAFAEDAVRLRDDFLSLASHELRTPLTSLQLSIQALQRAPDGARGMLTKAQQKARRLSDLVEELVDVAPIHLGRVRLAPTDVDLSALVGDVAASHRSEAEQARSTVTIVGDPSVVGRWDRGHLAHVVSALLSNALKFGAGAPVEIAVSRHDGCAQLTVRDHGLGIPRGRLPFVFDLFERAAPAANYGGLGLGLYVVRALVEAHGGSTHVESEVGSGSTFTIDLPITEVAAARPASS
jgi:signal transduction histidine kinase